MKLAVETLLARRLKARSRSGAGATAVVGVGLALAVMIVSVAVLDGFKKGIRERVTDFEAPLTLAVASTAPGPYGSAEGSPLSLEPWLADAIREAAPEARPRPAALRPALLTSDSEFRALMLKGLPADSGATEAFPATVLLRGRMAAGRDEVVVSRLTADELAVDTGARLTACFFMGTDQGAPMKARRLTVTGVYDSGFGDYDGRMAYAPLGLLASVDGLGEGEGTRLELLGVADGDIDAAAARLGQSLFEAYYRGVTPQVVTVDTVHRSGAVYFNWLRMLDANVAVILVLMAVVAAFTVISSLFILVLENVGVIGLLKAQGATDGMIRTTFILLAERLVGKGLVVGNAVGLGLVWLQSATHLLPLDPATYYMSYVPTSLSVWAVLALNGGMLVLAALVLILPSQIIAGLSPARTLRFE